MNNDIPYYSTISRESIVKRIKRYAGEEYNFEEFVALDKRTSVNASRSTGGFTSGLKASRSMPPVIHKGSPLSSSRSNKKKLK